MNKISKMKKDNVFISFVVLVGLFAVYNLMLFIISGFSGHSLSFWISYVFAVVSFVLCGVFNCLVFKDSQPFRYWFLGFPIIKWSAIYLLASIALSSIFMLLNALKITAALHVLLTAAYCLIALSCYFQKEHIVHIEQKNEAVSKIRLMYAKIEGISKTCKDDELRSHVKKLAEILRFSDPVNNPQLDFTESQIDASIDRLSTVEGKEAIHLADEIIDMVMKRNEMCKALKRYTGKSHES